MVIIFILFIAGACFGSFLNVLIDRLPAGKSIIFPASSCDYCRTKLKWYDLVPIASFILLLGKCRYCQKTISWQYPTVEITTGILFILTYTSIIQIIEVFNLLNLIYYLIIISGLIAIFFTDLKYRIIPDQILIVMLIASLIFQLSISQTDLLNHLISAFGFFLMFLFLVIITRGKGMGLGDVKFAFVIGFLVGFPKVIVAFYLAFLTGAALSLILILAGRKTMKSTIPFGPFLSGATVTSLYFGDRLWGVLKGLIGI